MQLTPRQFQTVNNWMYRNARPLDLARWQYHFEKGSRDNVLKALGAYQNEDGGFGLALEADSWNPHSSPMVSWVATEILFELGEVGDELPLVHALLHYLESALNYDEGYWYGMLASNNAYPHAPWWTYRDDATVKATWRQNPTIALAGFVLCFARHNSGLWKTCAAIAQKVVNAYLAGPLLDEMHEAACFVRFFEYCQKGGIVDLVDMAALQAKISEQVAYSVTQDTTRWKSEYICRPSLFINSPVSVFYPVIKAAAQYEAAFIIESINQDGVWDLTWDWEAYPETWPVAKTWWQGSLAIQNMLYLRNFGKLEPL